MSWHQTFTENFIFFSRETEYDSESKSNWFQLSQYVNFLFVFCCFCGHCGGCSIIGLLVHMNPSSPGESVESENIIQESKVSWGVRWARPPFQQWKLMCDQTQPFVISRDEDRGQDTKGHFIKSISWVVVVVVQSLSCVWLFCNLMDCSRPSSSVHGISQTRMLEWVAIPFSRGSSHTGIRPTSPTLVGRFFITEPPGSDSVIWVNFCIYQLASDSQISSWSLHFYSPSYNSSFWQLGSWGDSTWAKGIWSHHPPRLHPNPKVPC